MTATRNPFIYLTTVLLFLHGFYAMGAKLSLPVELSIENGDYINCSVGITKNGIQQELMPGKSILNIKLEFNSNYILSFSKPGYITKKITVNTTVTPEREQQLFEPYKIGVKLFKQYEGINIVVYNQPVAKIKFNPALDDFDYDVDYTKSILSQLQPAEQQLETRATEERRLIASGELPQEGFEIKASSSERYAQFQKINGAQGISPANNSGDNSSYQIYPSQDPVDTAILNGGADHLNPSNLNDGNQPPSANIINKGDDEKNNAINAGGANKAKGVLNTDDGKDKNKTLSGADNFDIRPSNNPPTTTSAASSNNVSSNSGVDEKIATTTPLQSGISRTKEFTIEPNRTITTIKMNYGSNSTIYRKVLYNWGGLYYFKNLSYSISQDIFQTGTGEK